MVFGGLQKLSLSDFPGRIAAIVFTRGCNFRCPYCHNPELVDPARYGDSVPWDLIMRHLSSRRGKLQGVVVTGGEPTIHADLPDFLREAHRLGLSVKLDTNGGLPERLGRVLTEGLADYVALDFKAPLDSYRKVAGTTGDPRAVAESLRIVRESGVDYEIRTTYAPAFLSVDELKAIADTVRGCKRFVLQRFRPTKSVDPATRALREPTRDELEEARAIFESAGVDATLR